MCPSIGFKIVNFVGCLKFYYFVFRRADSESKQALRDVGAVAGLTAAAMEAKKESTLKSVLSALWNLSAHCSMNKVFIFFELQISGFKL